MFRAFWIWASGGDVCDEKWFFDKSVWQKMFRTMTGCGFNALFYANSHPFSTMLDCRQDSDDSAAVDYRQMHQWVFENALDYNIGPYLVVNPADLQTQIQSEGLTLDSVGSGLRMLLDEYPELCGLVIDRLNDAPIDLVQQGIVDVLDAVRPDASLYMRVQDAGPDDPMRAIKRRGSRKIEYSVKFTRDHLVDENPDAHFISWAEHAGAQNVTAEIECANFEPWTSFSYDTAGGVLANLQELGCGGFSIKPLCPGEWPHSSDSYFKYQWQRDLVWHSVWGGSSIEQLKKQGRPRWMSRNSRLVSGFEAGSRILELLALYFAGDRSSGWRPQYCSIETKRGAHLMSIADILRPEDLSEYSGRDWWQEVTGDQVVHLGEYIHRGAAENTYGPEELIEELDDLSQLAISAGEKGMRSASGEKELPGFARDAFCMGRLGEFYVERLRAALSYARGENAEAAEHTARALGLYREIAELDSSHRDTFTLRWHKSSVQGGWNPIIRALEREHEDIISAQFKPGSDYPIQ